MSATTSPTPATPAPDTPAPGPLSPKRRLTAFEKLFPETRFAQFTHRDHRFVFFSLVNEVVRPEHVVLDFGAGRGAHAESGPHMRTMCTFQGRVARVVGVDVDPAVLTNPLLDERHVLEPDGRIPMPDNSVDLIYSFAVFEHVTNPSVIAAEFDRVLKPGGWICAWTPNKWGYISIGARMVPEKWHGRVLRMASPTREERDTFPTRYEMNTLGQIRRLFPAARYEDFSFGFNAQPSYHFGSTLIARFWLIYMAVLPRTFAQSLMIFFRKR